MTAIPGVGGVRALPARGRGLPEAFLATLDPYHDIGLIGGGLALAAGMAVLGKPTGDRDSIGLAANERND